MSLYTLMSDELSEDGIHSPLRIVVRETDADRTLCEIEQLGPEMFAVRVGPGVSIETLE